MPALVGIMLVAAFVFVACVLGTLLGALAGWVVGLFFSDTLALLATALNMPHASPWQLGAIFGFVGGFFRSTSK